MQYIFKMKKNEEARNASHSDDERDVLKKGRSSPSPDGGSRWGGSSISKGTGAPSQFGKS
ncbi:MAG: hypothetical protein ACK521_11895 [bacterium]|jgi:hypothetical protein